MLGGSPLPNGKPATTVAATTVAASDALSGSRLTSRISTQVPKYESDVTSRISRTEVSSVTMSLGSVPAQPRKYVQSPLSSSRLAAPPGAKVVQQGGPSFVAAPKMVAAAPQASRIVVQGFAPPPQAGGTTAAASAGTPGRLIGQAMPPSPGMAAMPASPAGYPRTASVAAATTVQMNYSFAATAASTTPGVASPFGITNAPSTGRRPVSDAGGGLREQQVMGGISQDYVASLERRLADMEITNACKTHQAFLFIKPHAVNERVAQMVKESLMNLGIFVLADGNIPAEDIDRHSLIDTHYGAIAAKAVSQLPSELVVQPTAQEEFLQTFHLSWEEALQQNTVFNAMDAASALNISTEDLGVRWSQLQKGADMIKFGGGFYCGRIESIFVINGFYMGMRGKFTTPGSCIHWMEVEWDARMLSWADFRGRVLGITDPQQAAQGSIRKAIHDAWQMLGLEKVPDTGDNGVHASASPFEGLAERANWLSLPIETDFFGKALLASGIPLSTIEEWCKDPAVNFEGRKQSLFDLLEDLDARECLRKASEIFQENQ